MCLLGYPILRPPRDWNSPNFFLVSAILFSQESASTARYAKLCGRHWGPPQSESVLNPGRTAEIVSLLVKDDNRIPYAHAGLGSFHLRTYGQRTLRAGIAACILLAGAGKQVGSPSELGSESMIESPKGEKRTYELWFDNRTAAARKISSPPRLPDNILGNMPLCDLEFLDAGTGLSNRLLNWDCLRTRKYS